MEKHAKTKVRTVAIGSLYEKQSTDGEREIHVGQISYFSRLTDASSFIDQAEVEMLRSIGEICVTIGTETIDAGCPTAFCK